MECRLDIPEVKVLKKDELTVGREFYLVCQGEWPKRPLDSGKFLLTDEDVHKIKLLKSEFRNPTEVDLLVTSYVAGNHRFEDLKFQIEDQEVSLGPVEFNVASVLPKDPKEKVEPFGPQGPLQLSWPLWLWLSLALFIGLALLFFVTILRRWWQRRKLLEELSVHDSSQSALHQFHQNLRKLVREKNIYVGASLGTEDVRAAIMDLQAMYELFLTREFLVPMKQWPLSAVLKSLKRYQKAVFKAHGNDLILLAEEFSKVQKSEVLTIKDALVMIDRTRILFEKMDQLKKQKEQA